MADPLADAHSPGSNPEQERSATVLGVVVGAVGVVHPAGSAPARLAVTMSFALPVGIWWFYFRLLDRVGDLGMLPERRQPSATSKAVTLRVSRLSSTPIR